VRTFFALSLSLLGVCLTALGPSPGQAQEWTRFRGPNGTGLSDATTVPVKWTEKDYHWKVALPGGGHSSPVLWGDKVFVTSGDTGAPKTLLSCLKAADGGALWTREFQSKHHNMNGLNSYATPTPAVDARRVYLCWVTPERFNVAALDHDGTEVWRRDLGPFVSQHGHGASPIVLEDLVVLSNDQDGRSFLIALEAATGKTRWLTERRSVKAAYSTPCVFQREGGPAELIFTSMAHGVTSVDPQTGKVNWEVAGAFPKRVVSSPLAAAGLIFGQCGEAGSGMHVSAIRPDPKSPEIAAKEAYKITRTPPYVPTPVAKGDLVFLWGDSGTVTCIRAATGEEVWREKVGGQFYGSPVCVNGRLYCISTKGEVVVLAAADKYELLARNPLGEPSQATPAVSGGRMYLRTYSHLISIGGAR
jgi:outer membrane protein assembly factor BamB